MDLMDFFMISIHSELTSMSLTLYTPQCQQCFGRHINKTDSDSIDKRWIIIK